jgi:hypothetical protein
MRSDWSIVPRQQVIDAAAWMVGDAGDDVFINSSA